MKVIYCWGAALISLLAAACGDNSSASGGAGGNVGVGGAASTGGKAATGGSQSSPEATGGKSSNTNTGGGTTASTSAKSSATGGASSQTTGGKSAVGGSSAQPTGGKSASGGASSTPQPTGGKTATASTQAAGGTGGTTATSSATGLGGATGGKSSSSSAPTTGGQSTGGTTNAGGSSNGGAQPTGGSSSTSSSTAVSSQSSGCGKTPSIASSQWNNGTTIPITAAGKQRRFVLNVPSNYDNTHPYRLVVVFHHRDGNDKLMHNWQYYGLLPLSKDSTIFVAPNGQKDGSPCSGTGNGESNCGWPNSSDSDLALADAVVAQIEDNFCINKNSILATGWSYGGSMSYRTACSRPLSATGTASWGVRAIAIYSAAQLSGNCTPNNPVAVYASHGTHDSVLNYDSMGLPLSQNFAKANGCTWATPTKVSSGTHVCTNLTGCREGYPLEFCSFNGDHTPYPDNGQASGSWGPQEAWKFLSQY